MDNVRSGATVAVIGGAAVALTPLTCVQQATVLALVQARRLDVVPAVVMRATSSLRQAEERLNQLPLLISVVVRCGIAYDACHDTGEALLAASPCVSSSTQPSWMWESSM